MTAAENAANEALQASGDAYRFGRIGREIYRLQRRQILRTLADDDGATAIQPESAAVIKSITTVPETNKIQPDRPRYLFFWIAAGVLALLSIWLLVS